MKIKNAGLGLLFIMICLFSAVPQDKSAQNTETVQTSTTSQAPVTTLLLNEIPYIYLADAVAAWNAYGSFDVLTGTGTISRGRELISFKAGYEVFLLNGSRVILAKPIIMKDNRLYIPAETAAKLRTWLLDREQEQKNRGRVSVIVIDAGHGGKDPGAIGEHGKGSQALKVMEKDVTLAIAKELYKLLQSNFPDKKILLTRSDDSFKSLEERVQIANDHKLALNEAIIYISIHANASFNAKAQGFEVWYLDPDYQRSVISQNTGGTLDKDILPVMNSMLQEEYIVESVYLARQISGSLVLNLGSGVPNRGIRPAQWFVVRNSNMPAVLVEVGFVTNPEEAKLLASDAYLQKITKGIYTGITSFIDYFENQQRKNP